MYQLDIEQSFNASKEQVFNAFTDPELMQLWFAPGAMTVPDVQSDATEGGAYRIVMEDNEGEQYIVGGKFIRLKRYDLIEFTWQWQDSPHVTKVSVSLTEGEDSCTVLLLNHSEFTELEFRDKHNEGWIGCLQNLIKAV